MKFSFGLATAFALLVSSVAAKKGSAPSQSVCDAANQQKGTFNGRVNDPACSLLVRVPFYCELHQLSDFH